MDCREAQSLINQFIDDRMDDDTSRDFIKHIRHCPSCYDDLEVNYTVMAVIRLLEDGEEILDLPRQLNHKIEEKEAEIEQRHRSWMVRRIVAVLSCVAGIFIFSCILVLGIGRAAPKKTLLVPQRSAVMNVFNVHRKPEVIDAFLYIKSGKKIYLVVPETVSGTEIFDIKRTSGNWGKLVIKYE